MSERYPEPHRRRLAALAGLLALPGWTSTAWAATPPTGWVRPRLQVPPVGLLSSDGRRVSLASVVAGKVTAVQLMFTGCSASCPTQGALFAEMASRLGPSGFQLLSVSIDALGDTPASMSAWQTKFGRASGWRTAIADISDVDLMTDFMKGVSGKSGTHTAQVFVFDRQARLCYRTGDLPRPDELSTLMSEIDRPG